MKAKVELEESNARLIEEFISSLPVLSPRRLKKYRFSLAKVSRDLGPFETVKESNLKAYVEKINASGFADWTKRDYRFLLKKFFGWLHDRTFVDWIKLGHVGPTVGPEDVFTEDDLRKLRSACRSLRDEALVETLYESACRPHEFLGLKKSDVVFDDYGAVVHVRKGKTGPRTVRVINATPLLSNWIAHHPIKQREAPLWVDLSNNTTYEGLKWEGLQRLVARLAKQAGVEKKVTPYLFRHTRLTRLASKLTEAELCLFAGWEMGSQMSAMYVHFSGRDLDPALLRAHGLLKEESTTAGQAPRTCVRCGAKSSADAELCSRCGMALSLTTAMKKDEELQEIKEQQRIILEMLNDPRVRELVGKGARIDPRLLKLPEEHQR